MVDNRTDGDGLSKHAKVTAINGKRYVISAFLLKIDDYFDKRVSGSQLFILGG
jgi:hypothetical protein